MMSENTEVFLSNRLERLADLLRNHLFFSGLSPFEKRLVIVPCESTKTFLFHRFAQDPAMQVAAGMQIITLDQAIDQLLKEIPSFLQLSLTLHDIISHLDEEEIFQPLLSYLNPRSRLEGFCDELAQIFLRYGLYGGAFLKDWEQKQGWQQELWHRIFSVRYAYPYQVAPKKPVQERFFLFGHSFLPRLYWQMFKNCVHYQLSPCQLFWGDVCSDKESAKLLCKAEKNQEELADYLKDKNRLLANMGKVGRAACNHFDDEGTLIEEHYQEGPKDSALHTIQDDILNLQESVHLPDASLQLHSTSSKQREVEVLLETLYKLGISPKDVTVYAPDIADYVPYIQSVFDGCVDYAIFDVPLSSQNVFVQGFFHLLSLPHTRFSSTGILKLFAFAPFLEKRGFSEEEARSIRDWVEKAGVLWGADASQRNAFLGEEKMLEATARGTWGHAFDEGLWQLAFRNDPLLSPELFGQLIQLVKSLEADFQDIVDDKEQSVSAWMTFLKNLAHKYFSLTSEDLFLLESFTRLSMEDVNIRFKSIQRVVNSLLSRKSGSIQASHIEGVRFFSLKSGKALPAQVIYLLGMEEESYPRKEIKSSLCEMTKYADYCPTSYDEDRYVLLELLLSARAHFIVSYQRISSNDGKSQGPSLLIQEIFGKQHQEIIHPQLSFDRAVFSKPSFEPSAHYLAARAHYGTKQAMPLLIPEFHQKVALKKNLRDTQITIDLKALNQLMRHPIQFYLQKTLRIYFTRVDEENLEFSSRNKSILPLGVFKDVALARLEEDKKNFEDALALLNVRQEEIGSLFVNFTLPLDEGRMATIQGTLERICPQGFLFSGNLLRAWPAFLVYLCLGQGAPQLLLTQSAEIKPAPTEDPRVLLKQWIEYYELCLENVSPLMPDWADPLLTGNSERLEKVIAASLSPFAPYRDDVLHWLHLREEKLPAAHALVANWQEPLNVAFNAFQTWRGDDKL